MTDIRIKPRLNRISLPETFKVEQVKEYTRADYVQRISKFRQRLAERNLDYGIIYADREHSGNLNYFTGIYSPFEESILVIGSKINDIFLIAGNEIIDGLVNLSPIQEEITRIRIQTFSLQGFFREHAYGNKRLLVDSFRNLGIRENTLVGLIGWKYLEEREIENHLHYHFVPSLIVDSLRLLTDDRHIINASDIMLNPSDGLRIIHSAHQLATIEANSTKLTNIVNDAFKRLRPGMSEVDVARLLRFSGEHYLYYPIVCISAERIELAYAMPSTKYRKFFVLKYLWLANLSIGKTGNEIYQIVRDNYGKNFFVNPGHNIDEYQEWTNSIFRPGDASQLKSGMVFHIDVITETFNNDTIALASKELRDQISREFPETYSRIQYRRKYLKDIIGLSLDESVLPFSDNLLIQPFIRNLDVAFVNTA